MSRRVLAILSGACLALAVAAPALAYDPTAAANYAEQWWNSYNNLQWPKYKDDCTSFVSQTSWAGGYDFDYSANNPWYAYQQYGAWYTSQSWSFVQNNRGFHITKGDPIVTALTSVRTASTSDVKGA